MLWLWSYLAKDNMKKKKQKQRLKDMEKRSSEKGMDLMEAYTEKPPKEEVKQLHSWSDAHLNIVINIYTWKTHIAVFL